MRALIHTRYGGPEVLELADLPRPTPGPRELLVRVHASTWNRTDSGFVAAKPWVVRFFSGLTKPKRIISGCVFAGEVVAVGSGTRKFQVRQRVFGFDDNLHGGHGEYLVIPEDKMVAVIPDSVNYEQATASVEGAHYALNYIQAAKIRAGQTVFVNGATGAIGSAAVQLLKHLGVTVDATAGPAYLQTIRTLGVRQAVDYTRQDFTTLEEKYDVVFDAVGKSSYRAAKGLLKPGGVFTASEVGPRASNVSLALWTKLFGGVGPEKHRVLFPLPRTSAANLRFLATLLATQEFRPLIDRTYALEDAARAYAYVETGRKIGNVVVEIR